MRTLPANLQTIVNEGVAGGMGIGDRKAITRITIQPGWYLNTSSGPVGNRRFDKLPIRYFQTAANDQEELEFPVQNLKQVIIDRSLTEDAGTIQVLFYNANTPALGTVGDQPDAFGQPGVFSWARGLSPEAKTRWGQEPNSWSNLLRENALIRCYSGWGDDTLTLSELITEGYVLLNGMFLVDNVAIEAQTGIGTLNGRDMAKLLIEQATWPPLVPQAAYGSNGLIYYITGQNQVSEEPNYGVGAYTTNRCKFNSASTSTPQAGHNPTDCLDGNPDTYYLSESGGTPWIEFDTGEKVSSVYIDPYTTNVTCYVSVMEAGVWVSGPGTINGIPFVTQFGLGAAGWTNLPRWYAANSIRLSFSNLQANANYSGVRAGLREVQLGGSNTVSVADLEALDIAPTPQGEGYRICGTDGSVYDYGDANDFGNKSGFVLNGAIVGIDNSLDGEGYWIVGADGGVFSYGDAQFYGSTGAISLSEPAIGIRRTSTGLGYWIMAADGGVFNFGDAPFHGARSDGGDGTGMVDFAVRPNNDGYWQLTTSGKIFAYGGATNYGDLSTLPHPNPIDQGKTAAAMDCTAAGNGYWIATTDGSVYGFGTETFYGAITIPLNAPISGMRRTASGNGYYLVAADGGVFNFGDASFWGALPGVGLTEGNYCVDDTTEAMTRRGWVTHDQLLDTDELLSINPATGTSDWYPIENIFRSHVTDYEMVNLRSRGHSSLTTPGHKWLVRGQNRNFKWTTSADMKSTMESRLALTMLGSSLESIHSDAFVELVAWFWTEGNVERRGDWVRATLGQSHTVNPAYCDRITRALEKEFGPSIHNSIAKGDSWRCDDPQNDERLHWRLCPSATEQLLAAAPDKVPSVEFLLSLTDRQLEMFVQTSIDADGHRRTSPTKSVNLTQNSRERMDAFVFACQLAGHATSVTSVPYGDGKTMWVATVRAIRGVKPLASATWGRTSSLYTGTIWCPTVKHHNWLARRAGTTYFTGNSDYSDIVEDMCLYCGFWLKPTTPTPVNQPPDVFGNIETTGAWNAVGPLDQSTTDKVQCIDLIKTLRDTVGFIFRVDEIGGVRFECVDEETQAFTKRGWVSPDEVMENDEFYSLNPDTGNAEWVKALTVNTYDVVDQEMVSRQSDNHSSLTTKNHRWWTSEGWTTSESVVDCPVPSGQDRFARWLTVPRMTLVKYTGTVWCPTLERNQIWLARRKGTMYFTGNSPNYWKAGNFLDDGTPTQSFPVLDEKLNLTDYIQTTSDQSSRSEIIVSAVDPYKFGGTPADTTVTRFVPPNIANLHGIVKPAMLGVPLNVPITQQDQELLAEFLALQIFFANRQGQATAAVHPAICPNDQIKIFERTTGEANVHYVTGVHTEHDLDTGQYLGTYTTYWMGNSDVWSITTSPQSVSQQLGGQGTLTSDQFGASSNLVSFLLNSGAAATQGIAPTPHSLHAD